MANQPAWTVYLCQDKHLDYNWCGTTVQIELRMVALLDYYLAQVEQQGGRWNLDGTLWLDVYHRHRGDAGRQRLLHAIRQGHIGYAANHSVQLWGMMSTETATRALLGSREIEDVTGRPARTCLLMENWGIPWAVATVLTDCGVARLARGTYPLRAEEYHRRRAPWPLFWWEAANGRRLLVHWPPYTDTKSWGGYAEGFELAALAGEKWDALKVRMFGDRNTPEVFEKRCAFIRQTVHRYAGLGANYPVHSILLLGTGWDNWTCTDDYRRFVERFHDVSDGQVRLVDARYDEFFEAVEEEIAVRHLVLPTLRGVLRDHLGGVARPPGSSDAGLPGGRTPPAPGGSRCSFGRPQRRMATRRAGSSMRPTRGSTLSVGLPADGMSMRARSKSASRQHSTIPPTAMTWPGRS
ncbi:MAG: hypothetical protein JXR77_16320 [Lentisphaeria bacterium]|nr:hypothetical protein [Lentisphaeria bacterium]